jgi:hypothetical protein
MTTKGRRQPKETAYLVLWWHAKTPYVALFRDEVQADWAAQARNGVVVEVDGRAIEVPRVVDYYRRDAAGRPMPAEWKDFEEGLRRHWVRGRRVPA